MEKIKMITPLVEMDGDEMTRILWGMIKDQLILPFVDLKTEYYDLGLLHRNETQDQVTVDAANATRRLGVAVKCATITPNKQRMEEYPQLTQMWKSPNGTIRSILDGTVFRAPILIDSIHPVVKNWKKPITIARHAYGDVYKSVDMYTTEPGECTMTFRGESGEEKTLLVQKVDGPAVWQGAHNKEKSIRSFARACFQYAIDTRQDLWFSTKDTIAKVYDGEFKKVFEEEFESYKAKFDELGITYFYTLIDDAVARVIGKNGRLLFHGLAMRPGKPAMLGEVHSVPVLGLPGHPAAAYLTTKLLAGALLRSLLGQPAEPRPVPARLTEPLPANDGRELHCGVRLSREGGELYAEPVRTKSGLISALAASDGVLRVPRDCEGLPRGALVEVELEEF